MATCLWVCGRSPLGNWDVAGAGAHHFRFHRSTVEHKCRRDIPHTLHDERCACLHHVLHRRSDNNQLCTACGKVNRYVILSQKPEGLLRFCHHFFPFIFYIFYSYFTNKAITFVKASLKSLTST